MSNINFGIDLGTTNSGIGKYENGRVQVLKNPIGFRETLPSVVSFRKGRIIVGDKAREQYLSNAGNVFSAFKRKMGLNDRFLVNNGDGIAELSPEDLSANVLKELRNYVQDESIDAAVITIPASFDTIQSNATKNAGYQAGFKEVILLQEPVAACVAYANLSNLDLDAEKNWLVYDFGGGTFDVALVRINSRELKVTDNKGNNFLGGVDIDYAFIEKLLVPRLVAELGEDDLWQKLIRKEGVYSKLWYYLNYVAEEAKKQLSVAEKTWVEIDFPDMDLFFETEISQADFNEVVAPKYRESESFILELLKDNHLSFADIERIILVGGTTYIPYIREALKETSGTIIDSSIDPSTAVISGAAFYAGSCPKTVVEETDKSTKYEVVSVFDVKVSFEAHTNDLEELIAFKTLSPFKGFYRISRLDGGYDSGLNAFENTASEFVALLPKCSNGFSLQILNEAQTAVFNQQLSISQGLYNVSGQLLPEDICIELDSREGGTYLDVVFKRNSILPLSKTIYKTFSKTIAKNSEDFVIINVVEGKGGTMPGSNLSIGFIEISGAVIQDDLIQGTDIEIKIAIDESRALVVEVYIPSADQELKKVFNISKREVNALKMIREIEDAEQVISKEIRDSDAEEAYELSGEFKLIELQLQGIKSDLQRIVDDNATEEKYRLDEQKRNLLKKLDELTRGRDVYMALNKYEEAKDYFLTHKDQATPNQQQRFQKIIATEKEFLQSNDKHLIGRFTKELSALNNEVFFQNDENYILIFLQFKMVEPENYNDYPKVQKLFDQGEKAMENRDYRQLKHIVNIIYSSMKEDYRKRTYSETPELNNRRGTSRTGLK